MKQINELFNANELFKLASIRKNKRKDLIKFFHEKLKNKKGEKFPVKMIAFKLSPFDLSTLYYMKSVYSDIEHRNGEISAQKWFWFAIRASK